MIKKFIDKLIAKATPAGRRAPAFLHDGFELRASLGVEHRADLRDQFGAGRAEGGAALLRREAGHGFAVAATFPEDLGDRLLLLGRRLQFGLDPLAQGVGGARRALAGIRNRHGARA